MRAEDLVFAQQLGEWSSQLATDSYFGEERVLLMMLIPGFLAHLGSYPNFARFTAHWLSEQMD